MPRRKPKRTATRSTTACRCGHPEAKLFEDAKDRNVDRRIVAIRAIRDVDIERVITELRLPRPCMNEEQLDAVVLLFLGKTLPNASIGNGDGFAEGIPGGKGGELTSMNDAEERILASLTVWL